MRGLGRPKGLGRVPGSGRAKGTPNRDRAATIERIMREADPLGFFLKVARGDRMSEASEPESRKKTWWFPTWDKRMAAMQTLFRKAMPDMKAIEHSSDAAPQITKIEHVFVDPKKAAEPIDAVPDLIDTPPAETSAKGHGPDGPDPNNSRLRPPGGMND